MPVPEPAPPARLEKFVAVRRSDQVPATTWWSLPLALPRLGALCADALQGARLVVQPASALGTHAAAVGAQAASGGTSVVRDVGRFFALRADGAIGPCTAALFPPTVSEAELAAHLPRFGADLEHLPFTIAFTPAGDGRARHDFCFRVPGKVIAALEDLALGRSFGGNPGQIELALLQGLALRAGGTANLRLVMQQGGARLVQCQRGGRRQVTLLETGLGYTGVSAELSLGAALRERWREGWRRFPVGVVMFAGLPFFIVAFWTASLFRRHAAPGRATGSPPPP